MNLHLRDLVALVTGSSRGLGLASARALAAEGCCVCLCARGAEQLERAAMEVSGAAGAADRVLTVPADLTRPEGIERVFSAVVDRWGGLDILVNNLGLARGGGVLDTSDEDWQEAFDYTLFPAIRATRLAVPEMRRRGGGS